jgi:hypothetical protein
MISYDGSISVLITTEMSALELFFLSFLFAIYPILKLQIEQGKRISKEYFSHVTC